MFVEARGGWGARGGGGGGGGGRGLGVQWVRWWWRLQLMLCVIHRLTPSTVAATTTTPLSVLTGDVSENSEEGDNSQSSVAVGESDFSGSNLNSAVTMALQSGIGLVPGLNIGGNGASHHRSTRVIESKYGKLQGILVNMPNKNLPPIEVYLGVPYASPPIGALRFMPPVTSRQWDGIRQADHFKPVCPQRFPDISNETEVLRRIPRARYDYLKRFQPALRNYSEDCLNLNIYVPIVKASKENLRLPVMVYIHGESYEWNSGNMYDGSVLAGYGEVIVVTVNYRLGILGFLNVETGGFSRNFGLVDQIGALRWVEENISQFGGDHNNVTIFGHDYGAACVNFLMISPVAKGLFHRAILMSGSALAHWALVHNPIKYAIQLAQALNCPSVGSHEILKCLRATPLEKLLTVDLNVPEHLTAFGPSVDGVSVLSDPETLMQGLKDTYDRYDLMFGVTSTEGVFNIGNEDFMQGFNPEKKSKLIRTFVRNTYTYHMNEIYSVLNNEYTDWTKPVHHPINVRDATMEMIGDAQFVAPLVKAGDLHSVAYINTYFYVFEHQIPHEDYPQRLGCFHGEELPYVFGAPLVDDLAHFRNNYSRTERTISEAVMRYWTNFAKYGDPNELDRERSLDANKSKNRFGKLIWPQYETVHQKYLSIDSRPKIRHHFRAHKMSVWLKLIPDIHRSDGGDTGVQHHLLNNHDNLTSFEGILRPLTMNTSLGSPYATAVSHFPLHVNSNNASPIGGTGKSTVFLPQHPTTTSVINTGQIQIPPIAGNGGSGMGESGWQRQSKNASSSIDVSIGESHRNDNYSQKGEDKQPSYSTALSVTVAVGCSLLILNVLIFAGIYYQRDKNRIQAKENDRPSGSIHLHKKENADEMMQMSGLGLHTICPMPDSPPQKQPPPTRTPPPSPINKIRHLPTYPIDPVNACHTVPCSTLNIPRPTIKGGPDNLQGLPESQPLLLQNLHNLHPLPKKGANLQEVRV